MVMQSTSQTPAWAIASEIELIYKSKVKASERPKILTSVDAYNVLIQTWEEGKVDFVEQFKVLFLSRSNSVLAIYQLSTGGITGTVADPRLIFAAALKLNAVGIIISHNHPSGNLTPSRPDKELTDKIKQAGNFLDIPVLDHIIISSEGYYSFADKGLL